MFPPRYRQLSHDSTGRLLPPPRIARLLRSLSWSLIAYIVLVLACVGSLVASVVLVLARLEPSSTQTGSGAVRRTESGGQWGDRPRGLSTSASTLPPLELPRDYSVACGDHLWHGSLEALDTDRVGGEDPPLRSLSPLLVPVSIAISYCEAPLDWLAGAVRDLDVRSVTVYSKCNMPVSEDSLGFPKGSRGRVTVTVVKLPNVGRVDHSYTYHLAQLPLDTDPNEVQLFMKDTHRSFHQWQLRQRPLRDVVEEASGFTGYSCGRLPDWRLTFDKTYFPSKTWFHTLLNYDADWSFWHLSSEVSKFIQADYKSNGKYEARDGKSFAGNLTFVDWWDGLGVPLPGPIMPVCYAGVFAAKPANIIASRAVWARMLRLLERGDNILEGHYSERTYAAVLLPALPPHAVKKIQSLSRSVRRCSHAVGFCGTLYGCETNRDKSQACVV
mmetsp:Transcript_35170/g.87966  ORF Transcript_35170/g.87966 Transcript_35170/m.87966 type:complete len:442 (-) Transcript_35170:57-1382(-)